MAIEEYSPSAEKFYLEAKGTEGNSRHRSVHIKAGPKETNNSPFPSLDRAAFPPG